MARASTFPSGIKAVADYVHSRGLKLGIYSDAGYITFYFFFGLLHGFLWWLYTIACLYIFVSRITYSYKKIRKFMV